MLITLVPIVNVKALSQVISPLTLRIMYLSGWFMDRSFNCTSRCSSLDLENNRYRRGITMQTTAAIRTMRPRLNWMRRILDERTTMPLYLRLIIDTEIECTLLLTFENQCWFFVLDHTYSFWTHFAGHNKAVTYLHLQYLHNTQHIYFRKSDYYYYQQYYYEIITMVRLIDYP